MYKTFARHACTPLATRARFWEAEKKVESGFETLGGLKVGGGRVQHCITPVGHVGNHHSWIIQ